MSPPKEGVSVMNTGFPRVSGDEPLFFILSDANKLFSPRERG